MSTAIHTEEYRGCIIQIHPDPDADCPLDNGDATLVRIAHWHRRYAIGSSRGERISSSVEDWKRDHKEPGCIVLPLAMIDHSGCHFWIGSGNHECDPGRWDSGQVGFAWCRWSEARKLLGGTLKTLRRRASESMASEIKLYDIWQQGGAVGWTVSTFNGDEIHSCWGFVETSLDYPIQCAKEEIDGYISAPSRWDQPGEH